MTQSDSNSLPNSNEWITEQQRQAQAASFVDDLSFSLTNNELNSTTASTSSSSSLIGLPILQKCKLYKTVSGLHLVGGLDISFRSNGNEEIGIATLAILSWPELKVVHSITKEFTIDTPYISTFLSFREAVPLASLIDKLRSDKPDMLPQLLLVHGNGRMHPREAGNAVAIGLLTQIPTIGIGKEFHPLEQNYKPISTSSTESKTSTDFQSTQKTMQEATRQVLKNRGDFLLISNNYGNSVGAALLSSPSKNSISPIFVSPGHMISLDTSIIMTLMACKEGRIPEPLRLARFISTSLSRTEFFSLIDEMI